MAWPAGLALAAWLGSLGWLACLADWLPWLARLAGWSAGLAGDLACLAVDMASWLLTWLPWLAAGWAAGWAAGCCLGFEYHRFSDTTHDLPSEEQRIHPQSEQI